MIERAPSPERGHVAGLGKPGTADEGRTARSPVTGRPGAPDQGISFQLWSLPPVDVRVSSVVPDVVPTPSMTSTG